MQEIFNALSTLEAQNFGGITPDILTRNLVPVVLNLVGLKFSCFFSWLVVNRALCLLSLLSFGE